MIHDASSPQQWRQLPTNLNPADLASRGLNAGNKDQDRRKLQLWFNEPEFLWQECRSWPEQPTDLPDVEDADREVKITKASAGVIAALKNAISDPIKCLIHHHPVGIDCKNP